MLHEFGTWIAGTELSHTFQDNSEWLIPISQSIHIISVSVIFTAALLISTRLLRSASAGRTVSQLTRTLTPWMWGALGMLLLTGTIQNITEPVRQFVTPAFWAKMIMNAVVMAMTTAFTATVRAHASSWDVAAARPQAARLFAISSIVLWVAIIVCGRFIGWTWSFYV